MNSMSLEEKLARVKTPNLESQRELTNALKTAIVLTSLEDTIRTQNCELTATAYFSALLALLGQAVSAETGEVNNVSLATSVTYLLDLVTSHVPAPLLRSKFAQILQLISPALTSSQSDAPLIRAAIGTLESLLLAQDGSSWALPQTSVSPRSAIAGLLILSLDSRPKVRRRALDALASVLKHPPPSPSLDHPAADICAGTALHGLKRTTEAYAETASGNKKRGASLADPIAAARQPPLMHALHLVRIVAEALHGWPSRRLDALVEVLLAIARSSDEHVTQAAFQVFEAVFEGVAADTAGSAGRLPRLREAIEELKPSKEDAQVLPSWLAVLSRAADVSAQIEPEDTFMRLPDLFESVSELLASHSHAVRASASECLVSFTVNCIPESVLIVPSIYDEKILEKLGRLATGLLSVKYQAAWMEVFNVLAALFEALKWQASSLMDDIVRTVGELRASDSFNGREEADNLLGKAVQALGPAKVLNILPLNLPKPPPGQAGRMWLLPVLRDHVINTELQHFKTTLVPISSDIFARVLDNQGQEKTMEVKIFEVVVQQIWSTLPGYCTLATDIISAFDQPFAEVIASVLYQQPDFRANICRALQNLVESNKGIIEVESNDDGGEDLITQRRISKADARRNLDHLATFAPNLLSVLFNIYSETLPQFRGFILQCVNTFLGITPDSQIMAIFQNVGTELERALSDSTPQTQAEKQKQKQKQSSNGMPPASHTLMDLIITIAIYLPRSSYDTLFQITARILPQSSDPQLQKKAYKLLPRLATCETGKLALIERTSELQQILLDSAASASAPARRDRLDAVATVIDHLPASSDLQFIPAILSEVVISAKEVNEKARTAAFDTLVLMGERMSSGDGSIVVQSKVPGMPGDAPDVQANLEEYFTMVSAGLAGVSPHMISASIAALTRILYEFRSRLDTRTIEDLVSTMDLFLQSANREIVRSVLGFVKVAIVSLSDGIIRPRLGSLVPGLIGWSHEHKARFRSKVKHILERLMRRYGADVIEKLCPESDRKLISNIRKTKQRNKRKREEAKAGQDDDDEHSEAQTNGKRRSRFESEFDEAVYGSESSDSGSDVDGGNSDSDEAMDDTNGPRGKKGAAKRSGAKSYIIEDADEPLDLLDTRRALASISSTKPVRLKDPAAAAAKRKKAKTDEDGKLIFGDSDSDAANDPISLAYSGEGDLEQGINAYVDAIRGRDAAKRGQRGKLKFSNKRNQEERDDEGEDDHGGMDVDESDVRRAVQSNRRRSNSGSYAPKSPRSPGSRGGGRGAGGRGGGDRFRGDRGRGGHRGGRVGKFGTGVGGGGKGSRPLRRNL